MTIQYTTNFSLPYPQLTDTPNVPRDVQALATAVDGISIALKTGTLAQFASTTSAQLRGVVSDETGSGALVFGTAPTLSSPVITGTVTVPTPTLPGDIATKSYADGIAAGVNVHDAVKWATTTALTGTVTYTQITSGGVDTTGGYGPGATLTIGTPTQALDSTTFSALSVNDRVLIKDQATKTQNGIYSVTTLSPFVLTRATDGDNSVYGEVAPGDMVYVINGTTNAGNAYVMNTVGTGASGTIKLGTDNLNWTLYTGSLSGSQIVTLIGTTAVTNSTNTTNIAIATDAATTTTYPLFANSTTSPISPKYNTSLTYNASTATLSATTISGTNLGGSLLSSATPLINGTAAAGTATVPSRQDHVHPTDTTRAPLASPSFTGTVDAAAASTSFFATPTSMTLGAAATTATVFASAGTLSLGSTLTTAQTINIGTASTGASTYNIATGATANATTKAINIGTSGVSGSTTNIALGAIAGTTSIALYGVPYIYQPAITAISTTGANTLTIAQLLTEIITFTGTAIATFTLPTGTLMDGGVPAIVTASTAIAFDWSVVNTVAFAVTMAAGTTHTYVGNTTVAANTSARFRSVRTAATTWVTYRIS